jgi:hypothetical protein
VGFRKKKRFSRVGATELQLPLHASLLQELKRWLNLVFEKKAFDNCCVRIAIRKGLE